MRGSFIALLVLGIAFIATTLGVASPTNPDAEPEVFLTARLLRSVKDAEVDGAQEERAGMSDVAEKTSSLLTELEKKVLALGKKTKLEKTKTFENLKMLEKNKRLETIKKLENAKTLENNKVLENTDDFLRWVKDLGVKNGIAPDRLALNAVETLIQEQKMSVEKLPDMSIRLHSVPGEKAFAESMQRWLSGRFSSSHAPLIKAWAESRVKPERIYKLLGVDTIESTHGPLRQWLAYIQKLDDPAYYRQALSMLQEKQKSDQRLAIVFQSLKGRPELERVAENLQTELFTRMIARNVKPSEFNQLWKGHTIFENEPIRLSLARTNTYFKEAPYYSLKTYTLQYAKATGADVMKVKALFAGNKPEDALTAAMTKVTG